MKTIVKLFLPIFKMNFLEIVGIALPAGRTIAQSNPQRICPFNL